MTAAVDLESQLDELRQTIAALQAAANSQPRVSLVPAETAPYLGQAVGLTLTVLNRADSTPLNTVPVTLVTSWGVLRGEDEMIEGTSIAGVTGVDGTVRVTLRPHLSLDNNEDQDALESMLALLDPAAATPNDALATFQTLAQQYRWEANSGYRAAVDSYFNDFGQKILRSTIARDYMTAWTLIPATVIAHVAENGDNTAAAATATVGFRDWLGPWYQAYEGYATSQIQLGGDFTFVKQQASSASGLIAGIFARTGNAVDSEYGEVGKKVAQNVAQRAIGDFLNGGISDLSSDMRQAVGPILDTGSRALATAGGSVVSALGQTHAVAVATAGSVATKVDRTDFDSALTLKANSADLQNGLSGKADLSALTDFQTKTTTALGSKADLSVFTTFQTQTNATLQVKANASDLQTVQATLANKADQTALTAGLSTKANATDLQAAQAAIAKKADQTALDTLQRSTSATLATKADLATFTAFQTQTTNAIALKADTADLKTLQTTVAAKADASVLQAFQSQVTSSLNLKANAADLQTVQTALAGKAEASAFSAFQNQTNAALRAKVDTATITSLNNRITVLENRGK